MMFSWFKRKPWTPWEGGECPVLSGTLVDVKFRNGDVRRRQIALNPWGDAGWAFWHFDNFPNDIVAYRVVK